MEKTLFLSMKKIKLRTILVGLLFVQLLLIQITATYPLFIETYYSNGIYPYIAQFWRGMLGWIPFSIGDIFIFTLIYLLIKSIFRLFKKKVSFKNVLLNGLAWASVLLFFFYINWGFNYFRVPLSEKLNHSIKEYTNTELETLAIYLVQKTNSLQLELTGKDSLKVVVPYNYTELYNMAPKGYQTIKNNYPFLAYQTPSIKNSLMSTFQSYIGVGGYLNPISGEAHVNINGVKTSAPNTISHEMAHQIGYAAENEAEFIGFLASTHHPDTFFKYSGYKNAMLHSVFEMKRRDTVIFKRLLKQLNTGIKKDLEDNRAMYLKYKNPFEPYVKKGYNLFLKSNKQKHGIHSYNRMVLLLINYYAQNEVIKHKEQTPAKKESIEATLHS
ncbi:MAG: hypothetical protein COB81_02765 [Flavobacteriaceae bacterium]|nr:MAG: hypothetical protein COB81_02765 [Flavobacteriaceae bacterium]